MRHMPDHAMRAWVLTETAETYLDQGRLPEAGAAPERPPRRVHDREEAGGPEAQELLGGRGRLRPVGPDERAPERLPEPGDRPGLRRSRGRLPPRRARGPRAAGARLAAGAGGSGALPRRLELRLEPRQLAGEAVPLLARSGEERLEVGGRRPARLPAAPRAAPAEEIEPARRGEKNSEEEPPEEHGRLAQADFFLRERIL